MSAAESLIQASLLGEAIDHAPLAVLVADDAMRYVAVSRAAAELLGYTRAELLELSIPEVVRAGDPADEFRELMTDGGRSGETLVTRKDGTTLRAAYRAHRTRVAQMEAWVAVLWPLD